MELIMVLRLLSPVDQITDVQLAVSPDTVNIMLSSEQAANTPVLLVTTGAAIESTAISDPLRQLSVQLGSIGKILILNAAGSPATLIRKFAPGAKHPGLPVTMVSPGLSVQTSEPETGTGGAQAPERKSMSDRFEESDGWSVTLALE
jgi:hypothetical protein